MPEPTTIVDSSSVLGRRAMVAIYGGEVEHTFTVTLTMAGDIDDPRELAKIFEPYLRGGRIVAVRATPTPCGACRG